MCQLKHYLLVGHGRLCVHFQSLVGIQAFLRPKCFNWLKLSASQEVQQRGRGQWDEPSYGGKRKSGRKFLEVDMERKDHI